ncbi:MAG: FG-GAP-like repeat-containing protein [candidate division WOR-3 bacterium]
MKINSALEIFFIANAAIALNFRQVTVFTSGADDRPFGFDTDRDGRQNLILAHLHCPCVEFWEHIGFDKFMLEDTAQWSQIYDVGYLDADSLVDMVGNSNAIYPWPLYVYESPTYNSNPTNIVWMDSGFMNIGDSHITDLDQDGLKEILFGYTSINNNATCVYENISDNTYALVWQDTIYTVGNTINGDFDHDGQTEFITGYPGTWGGLVLIWECVGNDNYELIFVDTLPQINIVGDIFAAEDMDGNGKPEFLFTCVDYFNGRAWLYLYETIGDNNYDFFLVDSITNLPLDIGVQRSTCADIDGDGRKEIVWSTFNQWHIYKAIGVHQYQKIYSSEPSEFSDYLVNCWDLNRNGYPEVIVSWYRNGTPFLEGTTIWEIQGVKILQPNYGYILHPGESYQIIWQKFDPPGADSFALFFSSDNGNTYDTIALGIPGGDTTYQWLVPDVISDSCKIMIWAYGPPRPGENRPRGVAWDFGDFKIRPLGIENDAGYRIHDTGLKILQNPVIDGRLKIQYAVPEPSKVKLMIYNVLGQVEQTLFDGYKPAGIYEIETPKSLTSGVYFVKLFVNEKVITKKCVILKD